ncbi:MAG: hypothetical protein ACI906_001743 [Candidatus Latescibacterota bacterium]|jgi:hypothetical protein
MGLSQPGRVYTNQNTQKHIKKELLFDRFDLQRVKKKTPPYCLKSTLIAILPSDPKAPNRHPLKRDDGVGPSNNVHPARHRAEKWTAL